VSVSSGESSASASAAFGEAVVWFGAADGFPVPADSSVFDAQADANSKSARVETEMRTRERFMETFLDREPHRDPPRAGCRSSSKVPEIFAGG